jgi:hypothetical protein
MVDAVRAHSQNSGNPNVEKLSFGSETGAPVMPQPHEESDPIPVDSLLSIETGANPSC